MGSEEPGVHMFYSKYTKRLKDLISIFFSHSVHWGTNLPSQKHQLPLCLQALPLKSANCPSPPFLGNPPSVYWIFVTPLPPKNRILQ